MPDRAVDIVPARSSDAAVTMLLEMLGKHRGDAAALLVEDAVVSYAKLRAGVDRFARQLLADRNDLGEERIAMLLPTGRDYVTALLGIWRCCRAVEYGRSRQGTRIRNPYRACDTSRQFRQAGRKDCGEL